MWAMFDEIALSRVRWATRALVLMSREVSMGWFLFLPSPGPSPLGEGPGEGGVFVTPRVR
jgi:hypothetical protein